MKTKVLIIDDDEEANRLLSAYLSQFEFEVVSATLPELGLQMIKSKKPALVVLDVMLPGRSGFDLCREIRRSSALPIIMVTARGDLGDRIVGLEAGADDYLPKPYEPRELIARIQSVLRRTQGALTTKIKIRRSGDLFVDPGKAVAMLRTDDLHLTATEISVLCLLMDNVGKTVSREEIYQHLRGGDWDGADRSVDMVVSRLRTKLMDDSKQAVFLKTMWGDGYRFVGDVIFE